jgi:hypothetical protein
MIRHSKHVFTFLVVIVLSILALFFWATAQNIESNKADSSWNTYSDAGEVFFVSVPGDMIVSEDGGFLGDKTLFQGRDTNRWFSLETRNFNSLDTLTFENIQAYISVEDLHEPQNISVDEAQGIAFRSEDGEKRSVWFSYAGTLYQIETSREFERTLAVILETWQFSE